MKIKNMRGEELSDCMDDYMDDIIQDDKSRSRTIFFES
jgi:hypothetical protein